MRAWMLAGLVLVGACSDAMGPSEDTIAEQVELQAVKKDCSLSSAMQSEKCGRGLFGVISGAIATGAACIGANWRSCIVGAMAEGIGYREWREAEEPWWQPYWDECGDCAFRPQDNPLLGGFLRAAH